MALNVKVGLIGKLDMLKFKNMASLREKTIEKAEAKEIKGEWQINKNAESLHPESMLLVIKEIIDHPLSNAKTYVLENKDKSALPFFRSGQYISLKYKIDDSYISRAYSIASSPKEALNGRYYITVRSNKGGFSADRILSEWKVGDEIVSSSPLGQFYYESLRDEKTVIALAGGSGITPFLSMAYAIRDNIEDFNLILLYGSRTEESILFKDELDSICASTPKVKVVHVLSDEEKEGYEHGFITSDIIRKYAPSDEKYSLFLCGPEAMYRFIKPQIDQLGIPGKNFRRKMIDVTKKPWEKEDYPAFSKDKVYNITVMQGDKKYIIKADSNESVLVALERNGIKAPSRCRSGECSWCRSKLLSGTVYIPPENDGRRHGDKEYNYIHPCASFATSDLTLEVPGEYY